jgi:hypothetical protein
MVQRVTCACPKCQRSIAVPEALAPGNRLLCPDCRHGFVWPTDAPLETSAPGVNAVAPLPKVGRFKIRRVLGEGEFGAVYEAHDPQYDRTVALKVARVSPASTARIKSFLSQAESAAKLRHTHIVPLFESGRDGDQFYLALAYIRGRSLDRLLHELNANNQTMKPAQAVRVALHLAEALAYAHGLGVIHRDINPHNVMLDENGDPLLMDFGLASRRDDGKAAHDGEATISATYVAPECMSGVWTAASDQYSLGVTMYELLTGETPFERRPADQMSKKPPAPSTRNPRVPGDLDAICLRCLAKDPSHRYPNCRALADDLRRFQKGVPPGSTASSPRSQTGNWTRRHTALALLVLLVLGGIGALAYPIYTGAFGTWIDKLTEGMRFSDAMSRGRHAEERKDFAAALDAFNAAVKIRPNDIDARAAQTRAEEAWLKERKEQEDWRRQREGEPWPNLPPPQY